MGVRLEPLLIGAILLIVSLAFFVKFEDTIPPQAPFTKALEFTDTHFIEVDENRTQRSLFSHYGVYDKGVLHLKKLRLHTEDIAMLVADDGNFSKASITLLGNVTFYEKEGYTYTTQEAEYHQISKILTLKTPFEARMGSSIIHGKSLQYNTQTEVLVATDIEALLYTTKK